MRWIPNIQSTETHKDMRILPLWKKAFSLKTLYITTNRTIKIDTITIISTLFNMIFPSTIKGELTCYADRCPKTPAGFSHTNYVSLKIVPRIILTIANTASATISFLLSDSGFWVSKNCGTFEVTVFTSDLPALSNGTSQLTALHSKINLICRKNIATSRPTHTKYKKHISR